MMSMTIRDLGDAAIYGGAVAGGLGAIAVVIRYTVVRPLKSWIQTAAAPARQALEQVKPNGGSKESTRHIIESTAGQVDAMHGRLNDLSDGIAQNRELALAALTLARETSTRLDKHLVHGHGEDIKL